MMKKKAVSLLLIICLLLSLTGLVNALDVRASEYLIGYSSGLYSKGNGQMAVDVVVRGVTTMDKIGVTSLKIEEKTSENGSWHYYSTLHSSDDPDAFYDYGVRTFLNSFQFDATPGYYYRVTATVYAGNSQGSDIGLVCSNTVLCK